jgi:hypothetical protein
VYFVISLILNAFISYCSIMSDLWFCSRGVVNSNFAMTIINLFGFHKEKICFLELVGIWLVKNLILMIQAQKHQNWSKFHLKLQEESKFSMLCTWRNFFRISKILNVHVEQSSQVNQNKIYSISSSFVVFAQELPEGICQNV